MYVNLEEDPESDVDEALADLVRKASYNGLSVKGSKRSNPLKLKREM